MSLLSRSKPPRQLTIQKSSQQTSPSGRIQVSKKAWAVRITTLIGLSSVMAYTLYEGLRLGDGLVIYSTVMPLHTFLTLLLAWFFFRTPSKGKVGDDLVSVIVPVYNEKSMIESVVNALHRSTYENIEVIVVNDGSRDGTREVLDNLAVKYPSLRVIHKTNEGKRKAVATGFYASRGKYVVLIDSDGIVDKNAITELVKTFEADPKVGATVGHAKPVNAQKNFITKCQDAWYDFSFNIAKGAESVFGCVTCCSGCMAAYRRDAIASFIPYWAGAEKFRRGDDKELTIYAIAPSHVKKELRSVFGDKFWVPVSQKLMESMARYDDAEDRGLTAQTLVSWKSVYVSSAIVYTHVPERWKGYVKQQTRWKKGFLRTNFFVNSFFWRKHPVMSFKYYTQFVATLMAPLVTVIWFFYVPFILQNYTLTATILSASLLLGLAQGVDYRFRDRKAKHWMYKPVIDLITYHVISWLVFPALWYYRKNEWLTR